MVKQKQQILLNIRRSDGFLINLSELILFEGADLPGWGAALLENCAEDLFHFVAR